MSFTLSCRSKSAYTIFTIIRRDRMILYSKRRERKTEKVVRVREKFQRLACLQHGNINLFTTKLFFFFIPPAPSPPFPSYILCCQRCRFTSTHIFHIKFDTPLSLPFFLAFYLQKHYNHQRDDRNVLLSPNVRIVIRLSLNLRLFLIKNGKELKFFFY